MLPHLRAKAALGLEKQIQEADGIIQGFEATLAQEGPIPEGSGALQERVSELQVGLSSPPRCPDRREGKEWSGYPGACSILPPFSTAPAERAPPAAGLRVGAAPAAEGRGARVRCAAEQFPRVLPGPAAPAAPSASPHRPLPQRGGPAGFEVSRRKGFPGHCCR